LVAPVTMRESILARIERETRAHEKSGGGHLVFKLNSLTDRECIQALYRASQAGVRIDLQVRSVCALKPGVEGLSDNIEVTSVVGRFLEHTRIYYFRNGGEEEILIGSADLMGRNLDRRVEVLFPIDDPRLRDALRDDILMVHLRDTAKSRRLNGDGTYQRVKAKKGEEPFNSQLHLLERGGGWRSVEP